MGALRRLAGFRYFERNRHGWLAKFSWLEASGGLGLGLEFIQWGDDESAPSLMIAPGFGQFYLKLPAVLSRQTDQGDLEGWGFHWRCSADDHDAVHFRWGARSKIIRMPWAWAHHKTEVLTPAGWALQLPDYGTRANGWQPLDDGRLKTQHSYTYRLQNGEVQHRVATIHVRRSTRRLHYARWLAWPRRVYQSIDVEFDGEVGEGTGSWKGGTIGCGYAMRPNETAEQTLRRMERERL